MNKRLYVISLLCVLYLCAFASGKKYVITNFGAKGDGITLNTRFIQHAIDEVSLAGGGCIVFPKGVYLSGSLLLKNNVEVHLEKGAKILGSTNPYDYVMLDIEKNSPSINRMDNSKLALLLAYRSTNISITGGGVIDGQGRELALAIDSLHHIGERIDSNYSVRVNERLRPKIINFMYCSNISIKEVTIKNSACWVQSYEMCENLTIDNVEVYSRAYWNNDGIDIVDCQNVKVTNCMINSADDGICLKSYNPQTGNDSIYISNCNIVTSASAIKLGTASYGIFKNIRINSIRMKDTYRSAIAVEMVDGGMIDGVYVNDVVALNTGNAFFIRLGNRKNKKGTLKNVEIKNMKVQVPYEDADIMYDMKGPRLSFPHNPIPASITGISGNYVENVVLRNIEIEYPGRASKGVAYIPTWRIDAVPEKENDYPEYSMFGELPAWGVYVRHVKNLKMEDIKLYLIEKDFRHAFVFDDVIGLKCERIRLPKGLKEQYYHHNVKNN
ncbi:glycoside hydrolase family 28 protein [Phocaeicola sp. Sa1CVN1]|uniref:Glycoside hydrolase family 28 protein n=1 Tax=Phocaeicola intestinalis TaxID=2762212 RepID=A0ABR8Y788_9BACT|nr:glycosyl hydrolase family 28 protein [Phocaeicola intestinalis]MBD8040075.1 glycoside hydrolase family 28 protein [Phocaeicola intestinalis]